MFGQRGMERVRDRKGRRQPRGDSREKMTFELRKGIWRGGKSIPSWGAVRNPGPQGCMERYLVIPVCEGSRAQTKGLWDVRKAGQDYSECSR